MLQMGLLKLKPFCHFKLCAPCPFSFKSFTRGENTHHPCSQGLNVSGWNGDCLIVSRRQSILSPQTLSPDTLVVMDSNRWNSLTATKTAALARSQAWTITTRLNLLKQQSFFFSFLFFLLACKRQTPSTSAGWKNRLEEGNTTPLRNLHRNQQTSVASFTLGAKRQSVRLEVKGWCSVVFTHDSHCGYSQEECFEVTKLSECVLSLNRIAHLKTHNFADVGSGDNSLYFFSGVSQQDIIKPNAFMWPRNETRTGERPEMSPYCCEVSRILSGSGTYTEVTRLFENSIDTENERFK